MIWAGVLIAAWWIIAASIGPIRNNANFWLGLDIVFCCVAIILISLLGQINIAGLISVPSPFFVAIAAVSGALLPLILITVKYLCVQEFLRIEVEVIKSSKKSLKYLILLCGVGIAEELLFRGLMVELLGNSNLTVGCSLIISGITFILMHFWSTSLLNFLDIVIVSVLATVMFLESGVAAAVVFHSFYNLSVGFELYPRFKFKEDKNGHL